MSTKFWTQERIDILTTYLRNGLSTIQIAQKLNTTLDAISSAIRRYNLQSNIIPKVSTKKFTENIDLENLNDEKFKKLKEEAKLNWNIKKTKIKTSKNNKFEIALFFPDSHIPHHNESVCKSILKLMSDVKFDKFIIMGDYMDLNCISHWTKNKHKTLELKRLKSDYIIGNSLLDEFDKRLPKNCDKHFLKGNHEEWADQLIEEIPALEGLVEPKTMLFLKERNYKVLEYNQLLKLGRLYVTHGIYAGTNPIKKHLDELKVNILHAHVHTLGMRLSSSQARSIAFAGYSVGCACDLSPDYMRNRPNGWTHGFAIGYFYPNGFFDVQLIRIVEGKFVFANKVYDGNK